MDLVAAFHSSNVAAAAAAASCKLNPAQTIASSTRKAKIIMPLVCVFSISGRQEQRVRFSL